MARRGAGLRPGRRAQPRERRGPRRFEVTVHRGIPVTPPGRTLLAEHDVSFPTRSDLEAAFLSTCAVHGLPRPAVNAVIEGFEVDFSWRDQRVRFTHRQLAEQREAVADVLRRLLG